jgi:hypothetical protein
MAFIVVESCQDAAQQLISEEKIVNEMKFLRDFFIRKFL